MEQPSTEFVEEQVPAETQYVSNGATPRYYYQDANGQYVQYPMQTYQQPYQYQMNPTYSYSYPSQDATVATESEQVVHTQVLFMATRFSKLLCECLF